MAQFSTRFTGHHCWDFEELPSTNAYAMQRQEGLNWPDGALIRARAQTAGKGQAGASWLSAPGENLTFSVIYEAAFVPASHLFSISQAVAVALQRALQILAPAAQVQIKWPNDLLLNRRKVAGVLIENQWEGQSLRYTVIGIGLNVNQMAFDGLPAASSLALESGQQQNLDAVLDLLLCELERAWSDLKAGRHAAIAQRYQQALYGSDAPVPACIEGRECALWVRGVSPEGLLIAESQGVPMRFDLKEVSFPLG